MPTSVLSLVQRSSATTTTSCSTSLVPSTTYSCVREFRDTPRPYGKNGLNIRITSRRGTLLRVGRFSVRTAVRTTCREAEPDLVACLRCIAGRTLDRGAVRVRRGHGPAATGARPRPSGRGAPAGAAAPEARNEGDAPPGGAEHGTRQCQ